MVTKLKPTEQVSSLHLEYNVCGPLHKKVIIANEEKLFATTGHPCRSEKATDGVRKTLKALPAIALTILEQE